MTAPQPNNYVDASVYLQVEPEFVGSSVRSARVVRAGQRRPISPVAGTYMVRLVLRIPKAALSPLWAGVVEVPAGAGEPVLAEVAEP
ncbi:hypothetical protein GCM10029976_090460 [Kribbella albertanoniae]|uniref:Uncharacterized protein n=1 Tax=Kribbella albertanoniae TaxID=1266829 RepID=A0A4R4PKK3_9ACTN|nr:hypothetical protein [Kribbella albertanoniae]TDC22493.1 hypothetical protein E1261_30755 [Kribbella albertanoniae]